MTPIPRPRPRCTYRLDYLGRHYCRFAWKMDIMAEPRELQGCPINCPDYKAGFPTEYDEPSVEKPKTRA